MRALVGLVALLAACSARPSSCGSETAETCRVERVQVGEAQRSYVVSLRHPPACAAGPVPLVIFFHGQDSNGSEARIDYAPFEDAIAGRALLVYPDGLSRPELGGKAGWALDPEGEDVAFVDALVARLQAAYCVDPTRRFAVGHSRGGRFTEVLACARGPLFRGYAESSAGGPNIDTCARSVPFWIAHATDDEQISYAEGEGMRDRWIERNGCDPGPAEYPTQTCTPVSGCPTGSPVVFCPYSGTTWRGHYVPPFFGDEVWAFFETL